MNELDAVRLHFSPESLVALDVILAFVLFGVALDMRVADFKGILDLAAGERSIQLPRTPCCCPPSRSRSR